MAAAQEACSLRISLLTCNPGAELYSIFGHTALRVQDSTNGTDEVFNYGTFEFGPDFYSQFVRGKLRYALSVEAYTDFRFAYQMESRSVWEQPLLLNCAQKQNLYAALQLNAREEARYYRYDFLLDNCTTRARDMVARHTGAPPRWQPVLNGRPRSFRQLIHQCLDSGSQYWSKLGIDLLLGSRIDRKVSETEAQFLPGHLMQAFNGATYGQAVLSTAPQPLLVLPSPLLQNALLTPGLVFGLLCVVLAVLSVGRRMFALALDRILLFALGAVGWLLVFMWWGTDHYWCGNNYNLLWALPAHSFVAFVWHSKNRWVRWYGQFTAVLMLALLVLWAFLPQQLNPALIPIVALAGFRCFWRFVKQAT